MKTAPEVAELHRQFELMPDGTLVRKVTANHMAPSGAVAGSAAQNGYVHVTVCGYRTCAHRVVWAMVHGKWPDRHIDHINGVKNDNRPANLRQATCVENQRNRRTARNNKLGVKGVFARWLRKAQRYNYVAQLSDGAGKSGYIGTFDTIEEARAAYDAAARKLHGEFYYQGRMSEEQLSGGRVHP